MEVLEVHVLDVCALAIEMLEVLVLLEDVLLLLVEVQDVLVLDVLVLDVLVLDVEVLDKKALEILMLVMCPGRAFTSDRTQWRQPISLSHLKLHLQCLPCYSPIATFVLQVWHRSHELGSFL